MARLEGLKADALSTCQVAPSEPSARAESTPGKPGGGGETQGQGELKETCQLGYALGTPGLPEIWPQNLTYRGKATLSNCVAQSQRSRRGGQGPPDPGSARDETERPFAHSLPGPLPGAQRLEASCEARDLLVLRSGCLGILPIAPETESRTCERAGWLGGGV